MDPIYHSPDGLTYVSGGKTAKCTIQVCPEGLSVYGYRPDLGFTCALIVLYAICMVANLVNAIRRQAWGFAASIATGCLDEILGYIGWILYWQNPWIRAGFIMQIVLITIGPVFFSAAIYVMLYQMYEILLSTRMWLIQAKCVVLVSPAKSRFRPILFYCIFIPCDVLSLVLQAVGGAMSSSSSGSSTAGINIALSGLSFQVATLTLFAALVIDYALLSRPVWSQASPSRNFRRFMTCLSLATILILIRCCYRIYELSKGHSRDSKALRSQGEFIGLESVQAFS